MARSNGERQILQPSSASLPLGFAYRWKELKTTNSDNEKCRVCRPGDHEYYDKQRGKMKPTPMGFYSSMQIRHWVSLLLKIRGRQDVITRCESLEHIMETGQQDLQILVPGFGTHTNQTVLSESRGQFEFLISRWCCYWMTTREYSVPWEGYALPCLSRLLLDSCPAMQKQF